MYNSRKKPEDYTEEITEIWSCTHEGCKGWMRNNFSFAVEPTCPQCQSPMVRSTRMLPLIVNPNQKTAKRS